MLSIGCDPGINGAIALACSTRGLLEHGSLPTCSNGTSATSRIQRKLDARALRTVLQRWSLKHEFAKDHVTAVIERMQPFVRPGSTGASPVSLMSMGHSAGLLEGVLAAFSHETLQPAPRQWKKQFELTSDKKGSVIEAQRRFPTIGRVSHDQAEAILLALWGLGQINGAIVPVDDYDPMAMPA